MKGWARGLLCLGALAATGATVAVACLPTIPVGLCGNGYIDGTETCDPGENPDLYPGCSTACNVLCPATGYIDSSSNHCYLQVSTDAGVVPQTFSSAVNLCGGKDVRGHVVTFVDDDELGYIQSAFASQWPSSSMMWAGQYKPAGGSGPFFATGANEPGWDIESRCPGCFMYGVTGSASGTVELIDGGAEAGTPSVVVDTNFSVTPMRLGTMAVVGPNALAQVVCEREPVGSRSTACKGNTAFCFGIEKSSSKSYLYNPTPATSADAAEYCSKLSSGGAHASLVVFGTRAEREQVIYELSQLRLLKNGADMPAAFWIGLRTELVYPSLDGGAHDAAAHDAHVRDGATLDGALEAAAHDAATKDAARQSKLEWVWENDAATETTGPKAANAASSPPAVWGNHQPPTQAITGVYAYVSISGNYDTGLVYAHLDDNSGDVQYPFVCQYTGAL